MPEKIDDNFNLIFLSDVNYKILTVEIECNGKQIAQVSIDNGPDDIQIEIYEFGPHTFNLDDFMYALSRAKEKAIDFHQNTTEHKPY